jgi:hypothetical protein
MSPSSGQPGVGSDNSTTSRISESQMTQIIEKLAEVVAAVQNPPPVQIGESQVGQIGSKISAAKSFIS